jgi:hypothetical protein
MHCTFISEFDKYLLEKKNGKADGQNKTFRPSECQGMFTLSIETTRAIRLQTSSGT